MSDSNENGRWPLPEGWVWTTLGEVANPTRERVQPQDFPHLPFIGMDDISSQTMQLLGTKTASEMRSAAERFWPDDVLYGSLRPYLNKVYRPDFEGLASGEFIVFRSVPHLLSKYLQYFLNQWSFVEFINRQNTGDRPRVKFIQMADYPFPLAPLDDQHRIVAEIEKQFTRLDAAVAALRRAKANLARYKAAVLQAAVTGRLVAQDASDEPASALLARTLAERRARWAAANPKKKYVEPKGPDVAGLPGLPVGWVWASIGQVVECLDHMRVPVNKIDRQKRTGDIPYYGANGRVGWIDNHIFDEPLVLVVEDETFLGRQTPFSYQISGKSWVNNHAHVLRPKATTASFLNYSLQFYPFTPLTTGTTGRRKLTQKALLEAPLALPPLVEQERIAEEIDRLTSVAQSSMHAIDVTLARADRLRQGVLGRAFRGESVANGETSEVF